MEVILPGLHPTQKIVWNDRHRYRVLACGRRWGKTYLGSLACITEALHGARTWWVAPSYKMAQVGWRGIRQLSVQLPGAEVRLGDLMVNMPGGGSVQVRSADDPQSLRGEGLDLAVLDECTFMQEEAWREAIRPALSDRLGMALFISTPKGHNWFWKLWRMGQEKKGGDWCSWRFLTRDNPYISPKEIEDARRDLPERTFRQEYEAEFLDDAGGVFRGVADAATLEPQEPQQGHQYVFGIDWAREADWTVIIVIDIATHSVVAMDRFNQIDYALQRQRLIALAERYRPTVIIAEANAMGQPIIEELQRDGLPVRAFITTNATKAEIIERLALAFERGDIRLLQNDVLVAELQAYTMERLRSGMVRYTAPEGMHDDCVMALALAWQGVVAGRPVEYAPNIWM